MRSRWVLFFKFPVLVALLFSACAKDSPQTEANLNDCTVKPRGRVVAASTMRWEIACTVPEGGVAPGGALLVAFPHPYYNNRPANMLPQLSDASGPGYAMARVNGKPALLRHADVPLMPRALRLEAGPKGWKARDQILITLGRGKSGEPTFQAPKALTDSFSLLVLSDPEGDGHFKRMRLPKEDFIQVVGAEAVRGEIVAPSTLTLGENFDVTIRFFDQFGNLARPGLPVRLTLKREDARVAADAEKDGEEEKIYDPPPAHILREAWVRNPAGAFHAPGFHYLLADFGGVFPPVVSNPIQVSEEKSPRRIFFGDLHGHTSFSDGANPPASFYDVAEGPAALSFAAVTDHEWQIDPGEWKTLGDLCRERARPGRFVPLLAWEFSFGGHGIVYYDSCEATPPLPPDGPRELWEVLVNGAEPYSWVKTPSGFLAGHGEKKLLYDALPKTGATFIPHTSATPGMGDDWDSFDPEKTALVEVYSGHGSSGFAEDPRHVEPFAPSGSVFSALDRGFRFHFVAASDTHDSRPGISRWGRHPGGLAAIEAGALTRRTVFDALIRRRVYATTGARIILHTTMNGLSPDQSGEPGWEAVLGYQVAGTAPIERVDVIKNGRVVFSDENAEGGKVLQGKWSDESFSRPAYYLLHVTQSDGEAAWSAPFFLRHPDWARVKRFKARRAGHVTEVSWEIEFGNGLISFGLLKRLGNDGGGDPSAYRSVGRESYPEGPGVFRDVEALKTGVTAYYMLEERNDYGTRHIGPVALQSVAPAQKLPEGRWLLGYQLPEGGHTRIVIRDTEGRLVRVIVEGVKTPGYYERIWDGKDSRGGRAKGLCFYQVQTEGRKNPRKPIMSID